MRVISGIGLLVTNDPSLGRGPLGTVEDAAIIIDDTGRVGWYGRRNELPEQAGDDVVDVGGRAVVPGFVDSHSHLVFGGDRVAEFAARMSGRPYTAGGIATTVSATRAASDEMLLANARRLCEEALASGTTTIEIKTGYGLTVDDEARSARVAVACTDEVTFLGAHVVPKEYFDRADDYVALVCGPMLEACADPARWIDVFCERGAFDADQSRAVLRAGRGRGLVPRIHANQLGPGPGVQIGVELGAASCDHCTHLDDADIDALANTGTVATLVPAADFSTRSPYPDARRLIDAGATVALATDCNPGSSYTTSMPFVIALAVRELRMSCDEALWAATMGGAKALARTDVGHLSVGAVADLVVLDAPSHEYLAYRPGVALVHTVFQRGLRRA